jgi:hypothetical protein
MGVISFGIRSYAISSDIRRNQQSVYGIPTGRRRIDLFDAPQPAEFADVPEHRSHGISGQSAQRLSTRVGVSLGVGMSLESEECHQLRVWQLLQPAPVDQGVEAMKMSAIFRHCSPVGDGPSTTAAVRLCCIELVYQHA